MRHIRKNDAGLSMLAPLLIVMVVIVGGVIAIPLYHSYSTVRTLVATVCSKEAVPTDGGHEYRVYTDRETFVVMDHVINGTRFHSADTYGRLQPNTTYTFTYYGWRIGFFSQFHNVISAGKLPASGQQPHACDAE